MRSDVYGESISRFAVGDGWKLDAVGVDADRAIGGIQPRNITQYTEVQY
jgi:hypothetical protein